MPFSFMRQYPKTCMPSTLPAHFLDIVQYAWSQAYILQLHLYLEFDRQISPDRLRTVLRLVMDKEPILGCRFVPRHGKSRWERLESDELDNIQLLQEIKSDDSDNSRRSFLSDPIEAEKGPQLKALLIHETDGDALIIKLNHQVVDSGGTKELGYIIASMYGELTTNSHYKPSPNHGSRSLRQIYGRFSSYKLLQIFCQYFKEVISIFSPYKNLSFPSGPERTDDCRFSINRYPQERVQKFVSYCRKRSATLNDLFTAALFHGFAEIADWKGDRALRMISTVDLRRYLPSRKAESLCNLSGFFFPNLGCDLGTNLEQTVMKVKNYIDERKDSNIGLSLLFVDRLASYWMPFILFRSVIRFMVKMAKLSGNIPPAFTNLGPIDEDAMSFGTFKPVIAEVLVPPTCPPFFAVGLSGFNGTLTLSTGYFPSAIPEYLMDRLFKHVDEILPS